MRGARSAAQVRGRQIIECVRSIAPETTIVARARYNRYRMELIYAGAHGVVDEEEEVGLRMAQEVKKFCSTEN